MNIKKEVKIGIVIILSVFAFVYGFNFLKGKNVFNSREKYFAVYDNINGLTESNPVMIRGMMVGTVNDIYFLPENQSKIIVEIALRESDVRIPKGSIAKIKSTGLLGGMGIELLINNNDELHNPGDTILSKLETGLTDEISEQIIPVKQKAEKLLVTIDSLLANVNSIFNDNTKGNLRESVGSFNKIAIEMQGLVKEQREKLRNIMDNVQSITKNLKENNEKITNILTNFSQVSDSLAAANLASTITNANLALQEVAIVMTKINDGKGSLGMLINDKKLYDNLENSSKDLDKLIIDLKENPKRYIHFSVFGKKQRKNN